MNIKFKYKIFYVRNKKLWLILKLMKISHFLLVKLTFIRSMLDSWKFFSSQNKR